MKKITKFFIFIIVCIFLIIELTNSVNAKVVKNTKLSKNYNKVRITGSPNWVHPKLRNKYKGYKKLYTQKQSSLIWQYSTNRQSGNIKGGGTTQYKDYKPYYYPAQQQNQKKK